MPGRRLIAPSTVIASDDFDRANDASSLGSTSVGGLAWSATVGTWGISSNRAYNPSNTTNAFAVVDCGVSDFDVSLVIATYDPASTNEQGLWFRAVDSNNWFRLVRSGSNLLIQRRVAGTVVTLSSTAQTFANGDTFRVVCNGPVIQAYLNGSLKATITDFNHIGSAKVGPGNASNSSNSRFDSFSVSTIAVPARTAVGTVATKPTLENSQSYESGNSGYFASHTINSFACSGSNRVLLIWVFQRNPLVEVTGVTVDGVAATLVDTALNALACGAQLYYYINPASSVNVVINTPSFKLASAVVQCWSNVDQTTPIDSFAQSVAYDNAPLAKITPTRLNTMLVAGINVQNDVTITPISGITADKNFAHADAQMGQSATGYRMSYTQDRKQVGWTIGSADNYAILVAALRGLMTVRAPDNGDGRSLRRRGSPARNSVVPRGVNIAGLEFAPSTIPGSEGTNYTKNTVNEFAYTKLKGFNLVRLPFTWNRIQPTLGAALDGTYKSYIDQCITWASANGLKVLLDLHSYGRYYVGGVEKAIGEAGGPTQANYADLWDRISAAYAGNTTVWGYGLMNEPHDMPVPTSPSTYNSTATITLAYQAAINAIRANDTTHYITACTDSYGGFQSFFTTHGSNPTPWLTDSANKLYYELHAYFDSNNSGSYAGNDANFLSSGRDVRYGGDTLEPVAQWAQNQGVKLFIGEFGVPKTDEGWLTVLADFLNVCDKYNIPTTYWVLGQWIVDGISTQPTNNYLTDSGQMVVLDKYLGTMN